MYGQSRRTIRDPTTQPRRNTRDLITNSTVWMSCSQSRIDNSTHKPLNKENFDRPVVRGNFYKNNASISYLLSLPDPFVKRISHWTPSPSMCPFAFFVTSARVEVREKPEKGVVGPTSHLNRPVCGFDSLRDCKPKGLGGNQKHTTSVLGLHHLRTDLSKGLSCRYPTTVTRPTTSTTWRIQSRDTLSTVLESPRFRGCLRFPSNSEDRLSRSSSVRNSLSSVPELKHG